MTERAPRWLIAVMLSLICPDASFSDPREAPAARGEPPPTGQPTNSSRDYAGQPLAYWERLFGELDPKTAFAASIVPGLIEVMADRTVPDNVRRRAATTLGRIGEPAESAVPVLLALLNDPRESPAARMWLLRAIGLLGPSARAATPRLVALLFDERAPLPLRQMTLEPLATIGPRHPEAIPALTRLLQYQPAPNGSLVQADAVTLRGLAAEALAVVGRDADLAAPILIRTVRNPAEAELVRRKSLTALGALRERGALAIPALLESLEFDPSEAARDAAAEALVNIGTEALPVLWQGLQHPDVGVRWRIASALGRRKPAEAETLRGLRRAVSDREESVRLHACESLQKLRGADENTVLTAVDLLTSSGRDTRMRAMKLVTAFAPRTGPALERLESLATGPAGPVQQIAAKTLEKLASREPESSR